MTRTTEIAKLTTRYQNLKVAKDTRQRGRDFEKLLSDMLKLQDLEPRTSYRPKGEEIDGSFFWNGQTVLLEAKWHAKALPASSIYSFKGKLDGKFHTTSGIFISMSGYGEETENALRFGKTLNILLFDEQDMDAILLDGRTFLEVFQFKLRQAGDVGSLYVSFPRKKVTAAKDEEDDTLDFSQWLETYVAEKGDNEQAPRTPRKEYELLLFVEGRKDIQPVQNILETLPGNTRTAYKIIPLGGTNGVRKLPDYLSLHQATEYALGAVVILDDDQRTPSVQQTIELVEKQIENAATGMPVSFAFVDAFELREWQQEKLNQELIKEKPAYRQIARFIDYQLSDFDYDPERDIPYQAMVGAMKQAEWDYTEKCVRVPNHNEYGGDTELHSPREIAEYLDEEATQAMYGEMPGYWLKEQTMGLDYSTEAQELLLQYYEKEIKKMGWTDADW